MAISQFPASPPTLLPYWKAVIFYPRQFHLFHKKENIKGGKEYDKILNQAKTPSAEQLILFE